MISFSSFSRPGESLRKEERGDIWANYFFVGPSERRKRAFVPCSRGSGGVGGEGYNVTSSSDKRRESSTLDIISCWLLIKSFCGLINSSYGRLFKVSLGFISFYSHHLTPKTTRAGGLFFLSRSLNSVRKCAARIFSHILTNGVENDSALVLFQQTCFNKYFFLVGVLQYLGSHVLLLSFLLHHSFVCLFPRR